jgi:hypothetical protein
VSYIKENKILAEPQQFGTLFIKNHVLFIDLSYVCFVSTIVVVAEENTCLQTKLGCNCTPVKQRLAVYVVSGVILSPGINLSRKRQPMGIRIRIGSSPCVS